MRALKVFCVCVLSCAMLLLAAACGNSDDPVPETTEESTVIEAGVTVIEHSSEDSDEDDKLFPDKGEQAELKDIIAAQANIESFYFEQNVEYPDGSVFIQVWYKNGKMRLDSSVSSYALNECFYDYAAGTMITYYLGSSSAMESSFDPASGDAPDNPVLEDYSRYTLIRGEYIGEQYCLVLETPEGDFLWIGTKYGFPVQAEFTDSMGERITTSYVNVQINTLSDADVLPPDNLDIHKEKAE